MKDKIKEIESYLEFCAELSHNELDVEAEEVCKYLKQALSIIKEQQAQLDRAKDVQKMEYTLWQSQQTKDNALYTSSIIKAIQNYILGDKND